VKTPCVTTFDVVTQFSRVELVRGYEAMNPTELVIVLSEEQAAPLVRYRFRPAARWPVRTSGIAATVLLHLLFSAPLILGVAAHKARSQPQVGPGSVEWASRGEPYESMILLDLSAMTLSAKEELLEPEIDSKGITSEDLEKFLVSVEPAPPRELQFDEEAEEAESTNEAAGDPAGAAALFGKYMGQISARIERAWMRPRTPLEGGTFACRAAIAQDRAGNVQSVELQDCGNDERWLASLKSAILRASPLSAPPEQWLFTSNITLTFTAEQYIAGQTPEYRYEPSPMRVAVNRVDSEQSRPPAKDESGDFELTISGGEVRWTRKKSSVTTRE
jgi:hypothetical protein